ncbi:hypothetical protein hairong_111 [Pseudomonas phage hairong]|nr:hypothetical protein hairong_111 [Pseudomonas phage hairong]
MSLSAILTTITGRQHYFKVRLVFYPDPRFGDRYTSRVMNVGLTDRSDIANERLVKKALVDDLVTNYIKAHPQPCSAKGMLAITEVYYLGWFAKPKNFHRIKTDDAKKVDKKFSTRAVLHGLLATLNFLATGALWIAAFIAFLVLWKKFGG